MGFTLENWREIERKRKKKKKKDEIGIITVTDTDLNIFIIGVTHSYATSLMIPVKKMLMITCEPF